MLVREQGPEQELGRLGLESGSGLQQGQPDSDWICSKETETPYGWEWGSVWDWDWVWGWSLSLSLFPLFSVCLEV